MHLPCSSCGSKNTVCTPDSLNIMALLEKLLLQKTLVQPGKYVVECKDCGHKATIMVR